MPSSPTPADNSPETAPERAPEAAAVAPPPAAPMPASVRIAVVTMSLLAGLLLLYALVIWVSRIALATTIVKGGSHVTLAAAEWRVVLGLLLPYLILGMLLALSTWFLPRRRAWARWVGVAASALLCLVALFSMIVSRSIGSLEQLLVLLISLGALISLLAGGTARWLPRRSARPRSTQRA